MRYDLSDLKVQTPVHGYLDGAIALRLQFSLAVIHVACRDPLCLVHTDMGWLRRRFQSKVMKLLDWWPTLAT